VNKLVMFLKHEILIAAV